MAVVSTLVGPPTPSDAALLRRFEYGERAALEELFRRYRGIAYKIAYRLLNHEADALDAVQEGFIKALSNLAGFQGRSTFKTWLLRIVCNAAFDLGRQRGRREARRHELPADAAGAPTREDDPGRGIDRADLRRQLDAALAALPEAQRQTFILHVDGELTYREVAQTLGISVGTVMSRLFYARRKLRGYLHALA